MNFTEIFLEHLIAGVQVGVWLLLLVLAAFGVEWVDLDQIQDMQIMLAVLLFPFIYPLGILVDNLADNLLNPFHKKIRKKYLPAEKSTAQLMTMFNNDYLYLQLDYIRRRVRISRSSLLNLILITGSVVVFTIARGSEIWSGNIALVVLFELILGTSFVLLAAKSWIDFTNTQYKRVKVCFDTAENTAT